MSLYNESLKEGNTFREAVFIQLQDYISTPLDVMLAFIDINDNLDSYVVGSWPERVNSGSY